ncbi:hypothetical protein Gohar_008994, partial [Gossypium harknessii]|nr:hypothetical protein [Gossypium harknessii]
VEDRILETYIRNLPTPPSPLIEPRTHSTFHSASALHSRGRVVTSRVTGGWASSDCVLETIFGAQIDMNWLKRIFCRLDEDSTKVQREQHARAYIFIIIGGLLMPDKLRNLAHLRWLLKLVNFREAGGPIVYTEARTDTDGHKPPGQYDSTYFGAYTNPFFFTQAPHIAPHFPASTLMSVFAYKPLSPAYYTPMPSIFSTTTMITTTYRSFMFGTPTESLIAIPPVYGTQYSYTLTPIVLQTPSGSLFYQDGPSLRPPMSRLNDTQWKLRTNQLQSTMDEVEEDERRKPKPVLEVELRRNLAYNLQPPRCGIHFMEVVYI